MRKYYWYFSAFLRKHGLVLLASVVVAIIVFSIGLPFIIQLLDFKPKTYVGVVGYYNLASLPDDIQNQMSSGLTKVAADGSVSPNLSERWMVEDDGKTYRFLIKKNIHWQDGKYFTTDDVNYSFDRVQVIKTANEVVFKLPDPYAPFPMVVSRPLFRVVNEPYLIFFHRQKIIGLGKFQVSDYSEQNGHISQLTISGDKEEFVYRFYFTEEDAINGFKRGEVDVLRDLSNPGDLAKWPTVNVSTLLDKKSVLSIFFNVDQKSVFNSKEIRQALNYALQKPTDESRALGPISPVSWAFSNVGKNYDFDEGRAVERLLSNPPGDQLHFTLTTTPTFSAEADQIKRQWETLGKNAVSACQKSTTIKDKSLCPNMQIQVDIRINNFPDTGDFQVLLIGQELSTDPDQYALWHSGQETNFTNYSNTRIDSLLEKGRQVTDQKQRITIYQDFQQFFSDDAPVIFMRYLNKFEIHRKGK